MGTPNKPNFDTILKKVPERCLNNLVEGDVESVELRCSLTPDEFVDQRTMVFIGTGFGPLLQPIVW